MRFPMLLLCAVLVATGHRTAHAAEPSLVITVGGESQRYSAATLLARKDLASISVPYDVSYRRAATYRAVPLMALLEGSSDSRFDTLEARATDGFIAQIPLTLVMRAAHGGAVAWLAIE